MMRSPDGTYSFLPESLSIKSGGMTLKNGKRPTRRQMIAIKSAGFDPDDWLVTKQPGNELHIVSRKGKSQMVIPA